MTIVRCGWATDEKERQARDSVVETLPLEDLPMVGQRFPLTIVLYDGYNPVPSGRRAYEAWGTNAGVRV